MKTRLLALALVGIFNLAQAAVHAVEPVLLAQDSRFGPGTLTLDSATGLQWLDLPLTVSLNYYDMEAQLGSGGTFAGFRHATTAEVLNLWVDAGIPYIGVGMSTAQQQANFGPVTALENLIGLTSVDNLFTTGMTSDFNAPGVSQRPILYSTGPGLSQASVSEWGSSASSANVGNWLVQVPEPSCIGLLGTAGLAFMALRRISVG